ncbi:methyltransferase-like protein 25 [Asbolus verrucosus]|uniref:Methyltransferase-like protein 25 n=1 Tax=Asbolus verrucosus TaxID=1661398 RepID=A0A482VRM6_ASBVE|nr:methyltransferase-like protein 25 [Asbolus verrucosus]
MQDSNKAENSQERDINDIFTDILFSEEHIIKDSYKEGYEQEPFLSFANCHMVDFFTNSAYNNLLPRDIQKEVKDIGEKEVINLIFANDFSQAPCLKKFVENSSKFTLRNCNNVCWPVDAFLDKLRNWGCNNIEKFRLKVFMTAKKSHEVEILSAVTASISKISNISHLVDIGDGKGYLSSLLALHHGIPVLGVDASNINTCSAVKRVNKLSKVWNGIERSPNKSYPSKRDNTNSANVHLYKQVTQFVDKDFNLQKLICDTYLIEPSSQRLGVVGLHTCGDLAADSLKIFNKNDYIKSVCNVGCCYHLITEKFENSHLNDDEFGFPLSKYLNNRKTVIGRSARMIANQSVDRILEAKELPNITIYYRALLQVLLEQYCTKLPTKHVGKFRKQPQNFIEYSKVAMKRIDVDVDISEEKIKEFSSLYECRIDELNIFYLLRCKLAPVIETLILLDRLLFLHEKGFENSFLIQFFDPVVSPRCYGIVALKNDD